MKRKDTWHLAALVLSLLLALPACGGSESSHLPTGSGSHTDASLNDGDSGSAGDVDAESPVDDPDASSPDDGGNGGDEGDQGDDASVDEPDASEPPVEELPPTPQCGDGEIQVEEGEVCDDGANNGKYGYCGTNCRASGARCGDGVIQASDGEVCDDGVQNGHYDKCALDCLGAGPHCGDNYVDTPEETCDDGTDNGAYNGCNTTCDGVGPHCGDGVVNGDESCDDGADNGKYGKCAIDCLGLGQHCGDGVINGDEVCDDGTNQGQYGERGACMAGCFKQAPYCGDGQISFSDGEACDDGVNSSVYGGGCMAGCQDFSPYCGDGVVNGDEVCDDSSDNGIYGYCNRFCTGLGPRCGDGIIQKANGEICDDGNTTSGDGCAANCASVESGFTCPAQGLACQRVPVCGDGFLSAGETCDDKNLVDGDGCSADCQTQDPRYSCVAGQPCELRGVCGDGVVWPLTEECDEGSASPSGGCVQCQVQAGWTCPSAGGRCSAERCGDGIVAGSEECDPPGDGCDSTCRRVTGYACDETTGACHETACGDAISEGDEACDYGDLGNLWDQQNMCTPACTIMLDCPLATPGSTSSLATACSAPCGSGMILPGDTKACDDGNLLEGDGCDPNCEIETGWECVDNSTSGDVLELPVVFRDFVGKGLVASGKNSGIAHNDFENFSGSGISRLVKPYLDEDRKPQFKSKTGITTGGSTSSTQLNSAELFRLWYRDEPCTTSSTKPCNSTVATTLKLTRKSNGTYSYSDTNFLPFSDESTVSGADYASVKAKSLVTQGYENNASGYDFGFTSEIRYWFEFQGNETLDFEGDDDVWVFINNRLALDLGGLHSAMTGSIKLSLDTDDKTGIVQTKGYTWNNGGAEGFTPTGRETGWRTAGTSFNLEKGKVYEIVLFHAERHSTGSNFKLTLGGFNSTSSLCTPICGDGHVVGDEVCDEGEANNTGAYNRCKADCSGWGPRCGDGVINGSEKCDDGVQNGRYGQCAADCSGPAPKCGDGVIDYQYGELCDDGASLNGTYGHCASDCASRAAYCGDGRVDSAAGEECDEGDQNGTTDVIDSDNPACTSECKWLTHICGDEQVTAPHEVCDDGSNIGTYGEGQCMPGCQARAPYCGDGQIDAQFGEVCDDGVNNGTYGDENKCMHGCRALSPYCGDGLLNGAELCDDGENDGAYGEKGKCMTGCTGYAPYCGDRQVTDGEVCDDGVNDGAYGHCNSTCQGYGPRCGDGHVDSDHGEVCDDGKNDGSYGGCMPGCKKEAPYCGDGRTNVAYGEKCDEGELNGTPKHCLSDCSDMDRYCGDGNVDSDLGEVCDQGEAYNTGAYGRCATDCSAMGPYCGDGNVDSAHGEACDDGVNDGAYGGCAVDCLSRSPYCGDGKIDLDYGENCDDGERNGTNQSNCSATCVRGFS